MARPQNSYRGARRDHARKFSNFYRLPWNAFQPRTMRSGGYTEAPKPTMADEAMAILRENENGGQD